MLTALPLSCSKARLVALGQEAHVVGFHMKGTSGCTVTPLERRRWAVRAERIGAMYKGHLRAVS